MNTQKVVVGGITAGVVIFILDFVANGLLFGDRWMAALDAASPTLSANAESTEAIVTLVAVDLVFGVLLVWLYAVLRPSFGPGPKTAAIAGIYFWVLTGMVWATFAGIGLYSWGMYALGAVVWLVISLAAASVGGMLYKEAAPVASAGRANSLPRLKKRSWRRR